MRYDYEFKKMCVDLYRQGKWPETPEGYNDPSNFHVMIRRWARAEKANGPQVLKHGKQHPWTPEEVTEANHKSSRREDGTVRCARGRH